jgi:hypothetical protein
VPNNQVASSDDFFFDGTNDNPGDLTNVWEMRLEDSGQAPQVQAHYITGSTADNGATGADCYSLVQSAFQKLEQDVMNDPNRTIDIVGFSRGSAEALDFANLINYSLLDSNLQTKGLSGKLTTVTFDQLKIRFIGLYDLVTTIGGQVGSSGNLNVDLPQGVGLIAHAVALSKEREDFEFTDLSQLNPNNDQLDQLGFIGAHADIGGDPNDLPPSATNPEPLTAVTLNWMNQEAVKGGWTTLNTNNENPFLQPSTINGQKKLKS